MSTKKKRSKSYNQKIKAPAHQKTAPKMNRRDMIRSTALFVGIGAVIIGGAGYTVSGVYAEIVEQDLSKLGNGMPTIVQIHDPQCPRCRALQRQARDALDVLDHDDLQYLVANIRTPEGRSFADQHDVGHVTLMLFDGAGKRQGTLVGERPSDLLVQEFRRLL